MRPRHFIRPALFILLAGCCPCLTGCLREWYSPSVLVIPAVAFIPNKEEVRAFSVDVKVDLSTMFCERDNYELSEIKGVEQNFPQMKLAVDHSYTTFESAQRTEYTLKLRLYRPGYETVEIDSWELTKNVSWKPAKDVAAQEAAVDALVSTWGANSLAGRGLYRSKLSKDDLNVPPTDAKVFEGLVHGSISKAHRHALLFAAGEYERVGGLAITPEQQSIKERVAAKAAKLRELAAK
jgi:hypothetical protein